MSALIRSQDVYDPVANIQKWRSHQLDLVYRPDEAVYHHEVAHLCESLLSLFKEVMRALLERNHIPKDAQISLERSRSALVLWSDGCGIAQGHLNEVFGKSRKLRYKVLKTLSHLATIIVERLIPSVDIWSEKLLDQCLRMRATIEEADIMVTEEAERLSDVSSSDASSALSDDNINEIAEDLKTDTLFLSGLDPLLKHPIFDLDSDSRVEDYLVGAWAPDKLYTDKIENRFPLAHASLASQLGKTNYQRYLRCQAGRDKYEREQGSMRTANEGTIVSASKFHDSGIGTSLGSTNPYAETIMSYSHEGGSIRIPPLSDEAKKGLPFPCTACGRMISVTSNSLWKRHIYLDLQPYTCLDILCPYSNATFETREKWVSHLGLDHEMDPQWRSTSCPLCKEETGDGKVAITRHLSKHLEEISLSALPIGDDSNTGSEYTSEDSGSSGISALPVPSGTWGVQHDTLLLAARDSGQSWSEIQAEYFPGITSNACRKRHERLMERKGTNDGGMRELEPAIMDKAAAERQRELELKIRKDAEDAFERRMKEMWKVEEECRKEVLKAKAEAERATRERIEVELKAEKERRRLHEQAMEQAERDSRDKIEAEMRAMEERTKKEAEAAVLAVAAAKAKIEAAIKAAQEAKEEADLEWCKELEKEEKLKAEIAAREKLRKEAMEAVAAKALAMKRKQRRANKGDYREQEGNAKEGDDEDDEPRYCYCDCVSYGEMVPCEAEDCPREWFHLGCIGLPKAPASGFIWYCRDCETRLVSVSGKKGIGRAEGTGGESSDGGIVVTIIARRLSTGEVALLEEDADKVEPRGRSVGIETDEKGRMSISVSKHLR
ncbi:hypothetical protein GQ53DRAFT_835635 [Thozetella sp. PMI_491]|nr:hypothetical protein GQ53DRAFT_835635 [Thozetella sp. PMI_491]